MNSEGLTLTVRVRSKFGVIPAVFHGKSDAYIGYAKQYMDLGFDQLYFHTTGRDQHKFRLDGGSDVLLKRKND